MAADEEALSFWSHYQRFTIATFTLLDSSSQNALRGQVRKTFFCSSRPMPSAEWSLAGHHILLPVPYKLTLRSQLVDWLLSSVVDNSSG